MAPRKYKSPRELAARALCRLDGHPEDAKYEGKPMWQDYLSDIDAVLDAIEWPGLAEQQEKDRQAWEGNRKGD